MLSKLRLISGFRNAFFQIGLLQKDLRNAHESM